MNTTPEQLRLAADLKESGRSWQMTSVSSKEHWLDPNISIETALWEGRTIRPLPLSFPPKPEGMTWHNGHMLTPEQVGDKHRLLVTSEQDNKFHEGDEYWSAANEWSNDQGSSKQGAWRQYHSTIRVPISTPFPDGSYLKEGQLVRPEPAWIDFTVAEGLRKELQPGQKVIWRDAFRWKDDNGVLSNHYEGQSLAYIAGEHGYTIIKDAGCAGIIVDKNWKPWVLTSHIPGFRPLHDGEEWCQGDTWHEKDLPAGFRPLLAGEMPHEGDEVRYTDWKIQDRHQLTVPARRTSANQRTRRPLPEPPKLVPLCPSDWLKDGPWWIRLDGSDNNPLMVTQVHDLHISNGSFKVTHQEATAWERTNNGIDWQPCSKTA